MPSTRTTPPKRAPPAEKPARKQESVEKRAGKVTLNRTVRHPHCPPQHETTRSGSLGDDLLRAHRRPPPPPGARGAGHRAHRHCGLLLQALHHRHRPLRAQSAEIPPNRMLSWIGAEWAHVAAWLNNTLGTSFDTDVAAFEIAEERFSVINTSLAGQFNLHMKISLVAGIAPGHALRAVGVLAFRATGPHAPRNRRDTLVRDIRIGMLLRRAALRVLHHGPPLDQLLRQLPGQPPRDHQHDRHRRLPLDRDRRIDGVCLSLRACRC